jgi:hypothetical protein
MKMPGKLVTRRTSKIGDSGANGNTMLFDPQVKKDGKKLTARRSNKIGDNGASDTGDSRFSPPPAR